MQSCNLNRVSFLPAKQHFGFICQVPGHGVISDGVLHSALVALDRMPSPRLRVAKASFSQEKLGSIFCNCCTRLPLRFVGTALASRKMGQRASVGHDSSAAGQLFVWALKIQRPFVSRSFFAPALAACPEVASPQRHRLRKAQ